MGLIAEIFKHPMFAMCSAGGVSETFDKLTLVNVDGPFDPTPDRPAALLLPGNVSGTAKVVPAESVRTCVTCGARAGEGGVAEPICNDNGRGGGHRYVDHWRALSPGGAGPMAGGAFVHTSDSRFSRAVEDVVGHRFYGAVALHDRWEKG